MRFIKIASTILLFSLHQALALSQTPKPTLETALQHFKSGEYELALQQYSLFINQYGKDPKFNFYYGACLVETNQNIAQAAKCLKFATLKSTIKESTFYLGRAYQLSYEFEEALANYAKFLKIPNIAQPLKDRALQYTEECRTGTTMTPKIYDITVVVADTLAIGEETTTIKLSPELGRITKNSEFFESGIDPNGILFITERGDRVFYSAPGSSTEKTDLFLMEKLIDGWSKPINLGSEVNSPADEKFPVLLTDGVTLYFSSNRPGGLGGWDIYKATYNSDSKKFGEVNNMGIPFNSPKDDYLFVPDEFSKSAWFATNRSTTIDKAVVARMAWNGSMVKNNVSDINQVKEAVQLNVDAQSAALANINNQNNGNGKAKTTNLFVFSVADTLEYTQYEHFRSEAALDEFKQGQAWNHKKDSLMQLMKEKRSNYAASNADWERNAMVNDILRLEKETYSIDAAIAQHHFNAQNLEQAKIKELVRNGQYTPLAGTKVVPQKNTSFNTSDIPKDLTLYSPDEFGKQLLEVQAIYPRLFPADKIYQLQQADSLYAWGNLLNIESSRMLEKASKPTTTEVPLPKPFKNEATEQPTTESLVKEAKEVKYKALTLYHQALDIKYQVYSSKYSEFANETEAKEYSAYQNEAASFKKEAANLNEQALTTGNVEQYEKAGALKRKATESQEKGFFKYLDQLDNPTQQNAEQKNDDAVYALPAYSATHAEDSQTPVNEKKVVPEATTNTPQAEQQGIIFKIQIGVFRNRPNESALSKLDKISTELLPESGLTKYFAGNYATYEQALDDLPKTKEAGFPGAFVVAFENGKQIPLQQARNNTAKN